MKTNKLVVVIAFFVAASLGFAQGMRGTGGGGMAGQPIDGTAIFPSSVTASGAITGDTLTATTTSTDAIYLNSGRPICMNAPTCNAASRIFYNGSAIQAGGGIVAATVISTAASGAPGYTCTNVGCRLSLGNTARYWVLDDANGEFATSNAGISIDGTIRTHNGNFWARSSATATLAGQNPDGATAVATVLRSQATYSTAGAKLLSVRNLNSEVSFIDYLGNVSGNGFVATTATGSALTGGGASGAFVLTSNTPDSFTDTGNNGAFELRVANALAANDALFVVKNSLNQPRFVITQDGRIVGYSDIRTTTLQPDSLATLNLVGRATSGTGILLRSNGNLSLDTDRAINIQNNITTDIAHFSKDGLLRVNASNAAKPTCNSTNRGRVYYLNGAAGVADTYEVCSKNAADAYAWVQVGFSSENASAPMTLTSNTPDSVTSGTVPAIRLQASQNIDALDLLLSVEDSAGNRRFSVNESGDWAGVRDLSVGRYFTTNFGMIINGYYQRVNVNITIPDSGGAGAANYTLTTGTGGKSFYRITCNDADGCDITMNELNMGVGMQLQIINIGTNTVNFTDTAGVTELAGNFAMGQYDTLELIYDTDRFIELGRSDN